MKKIDLTVSGLSFRRGKILFFLRPRGIDYKYSIGEIVLKVNGDKVKIKKYW